MYAIWWCSCGREGTEELHFIGLIAPNVNLRCRMQILLRFISPAFRAFVFTYWDIIRAHLHCMRENTVDTQSVRYHRAYRGVNCDIWKIVVLLPCAHFSLSVVNGSTDAYDKSHMRLMFFLINYYRITLSAPKSDWILILYSPLWLYCFWINDR